MTAAAPSTADRTDSPDMHAQILHTLSRLRLHQRRFPEAVDLATAATEAWDDLSATVYQAESLLLLGDALDANGQPAEAHQARQRARHLNPT